MSLKTNTCKNCGKVYKYDCYFKRHILSCELLSKNKKERDIDNELIQDIPEPQRLYELLLISLKEIEKLKQKNENLEKRIVKFEKNNNLIETKKNKIDILNEKYKDSKEFHYKLIIITDKHYKLIINNDYLSAVNLILKDLINNNVFLNCLKCYKEQKNTIFIKKEKWIVLNNNDFEQIITNISQKLMGIFLKIQDIHKKQNISEKDAEIYTHTLQKIIGTKFNSKNIISKIKNKFYENLLEPSN